MKCKARVLYLCVLVALSGVAKAQAAVNRNGADYPRLPAPSGKYAIGRQAFDWTDTTRVDPYSAGHAKHRELMVYIWYPALRPAHGARAEYFPAAKQLADNAAARKAMEDEFGANWRLMASGAIRPDAISDARPARQPGGFPVVLFSHGYSSTTFSYTAQIENFVSHGYVVVAIEHTDAAGIVVFPGNRIRLFRNPPMAASALKDLMQAMILSAEKGTQTGAEDVRFVLNMLAEKKTSLARIMDLNRVAAVGHSYGGTLSARACQLDARIKACLSEDGEVNPVGAYFDYPGHATFAQPFMLIEVESHPTDAELSRMHESRAQWDAYLAHEREQLDACGAGSYLALVSEPDMAHASFSDGPVLNTAAGSKQAADAVRNLELTESLELSFLDKTLKGKPAPLLDDAAKIPAGVKIERVGR
jgi:predicted dienelactone hydrolase